MKKHKYIDVLHCPDCYDITINNMKKIKSEPDRVILSPVQYKACKKYGYPEGLLHLAEFKTK